MEKIKIDPLKPFAFWPKHTSPHTPVDGFAYDVHTC